MAHFRTQRRVPVLLASALLVGAASGAQAHASLVKSNPAGNATVAAPKTITLTFNEALAPAFSKFTLTMPGMNNMAMQVKTTVSKDHKSITGTPQAPLPPGAYSINWQAAAADDGHKTTGKVAFTVK